MIGWSLRWGLLLAAVFIGGFQILAGNPLLGRGTAVGAARTTVSPASRDLEFGSEIRIRASSDGHYYADASVNNTPVRFLIDTGATSILLSGDDATRVGLHPAAHEYTRIGNTANGTIKLAPLTLREVRLGSFSAYDVEAVVSQAPVNVSLLGMGFLKRMQSWEVRSNQLFLRW